MKISFPGEQSALRCENSVSWRRGMSVAKVPGNRQGGLSIERESTTVLSRRTPGVGRGNSHGAPLRARTSCQLTLARATGVDLAATSEA